MIAINNTSPSTYYITLTNNIPRSFQLELAGKLYYFRKTAGKLSRFKFNVPDMGVFTANAEFEIVKEVAIELPKSYPPLPPFERGDLNDFKIIQNENLTGTPARIFRKGYDGKSIGVVELAPSMKQYTGPMQVFIMLHEIGHFFYKTEEYCDQFALEHFLKMGYNRSTAYYTLEHVLKQGQGQVNRLQSLFNNIQQTQKNEDKFQGQ